MIMMIMGIYHRGSGEPLSPQNLEWGTLMQIVPAPDFVMFRNFKDQIAYIYTVFEKTCATTQKT